MDLKARLSDFGKAIEELEAAARKLQNQNFADIAMTAKAKLAQLVEHPDVHLVQKEIGGDEPLPFDPKAGATVQNASGAELNSDGTLSNSGVR